MGRSALLSRTRFSRWPRYPSDLQNLLDLDGYEFEKLILQLFEAIPEFDEVRRTRSRADGGIDLVAVNITPFVGGRVAIQAKRYATHRKVDIAAVREIAGSISQREFNKGIIITTSDFTRAARGEATRLGIKLYERERLLWLLRHHLHREFNVFGKERRKPPIKKPPKSSRTDSSKSNDLSCRRQIQLFVACHSGRVIPRARAERRSMSQPAAAVAVVAAAPSRLAGTPATRGTGCGGSSTAVPGTRGARKNGAQ